MKKFLQETPIRILVFILAIVIFATFALLQFSAIDRTIGLWVFATLALLEIAIVLGPKASLLMGSRGKFLRFFLIMLAIGAGVYAYVSFVMVPKAVEQAGQLKN